MKKIIFLDFDGVLVTNRYQEEQIASGGVLRDSHGAVFDPVCIENLRHIIDSTDADIVAISTWKMDLGLSGIQSMWKERNLPGIVAGVTPDIDIICRGNEIEAWLSGSDDECRYAIIDDAPLSGFFNADQEDHLFRVDERIGLDAATAKRIVEHLNR